MDMRLLVQKRDELDASAAIKFIDGCKDAKLALIHASLKDEVALLDFFQNLVENLKTPFAGMRVSGSATPEGYFEDAVVIAVLCGDFEVNVFHEKINLQEPRETVEKITPKLKDVSLCLAYAAITCQQNVYVDFILRRIQSMYPKMQIFGGASSPPALVASKDGIYGDHLLCVTLNAVETQFEMNSGFRFTEDKQEFTITKSDEFYVYEIDGKNVVEEYSKIQHIRPYFQNMVMKYLLSRSDISYISKALFKASTILREGGANLSIQLLGLPEKGKVVPFIALELGDGKRNYLLPPFYVREGTKLKRVRAFKDVQLDAYEKLSSGNGMLMMSCATTQVWLEFDYNALVERLKKFSHPVLLSFTFGEFGATLPYRGLEQNVVHGGVVKALAFK
jgi:hypothetical protein